MSITPAVKNFQVTKGATFDYRFQYLVGGPTSNSVQDLTGWTGDCQIKSLDGLTLYYDLSTTNGGLVFGGVNGTIDIVITAAQTTAITWTQGRYTLYVTNPSNQVNALLTGLFVPS